MKTTQANFDIKSLIYKIFLISVLAILIPSCKGYHKLLKSSDNELKYTKAIEYFNDEDYARAMALFEDVIPVYKGTDRADDIHYYYSYCHYRTGDYILGGYYFRNFSSTYPKSPYAEECQFMGAYCYFLDSPRSCLDQTNTYSAINELQLFISRYAESSRVKECNDLIDELRLKLERKSFDNAKLYYELSYYKAANVSLNNSIKDFPDSEFREEIFYRLVKSNYLLASNSVQEKMKERYEAAIEEYNKFVEEFPESKYNKELKRLNEKSVKELGKINAKS